jgi:3-hydroxyisobutyrate dehydrogenase-like beta-hydroxyacid dehydrogenase
MPPEALLRVASIVIASLPDDRAVTALVEGPGGMLEVPPPARLLVDTSTIEPATSRRLAALLAEAGHAMLDAPVSGGRPGRAGTLTVMVGGAERDLARAGPVLDVLARTVVHVGAHGAGGGGQARQQPPLRRPSPDQWRGHPPRRWAGVAPERVRAAVNAARAGAPSRK